MESHQLAEEESGSGIWLSEEQVFVTVDTASSPLNSDNNNSNNMMAPSIITVEPFILAEDNANVNRVYVNGNLYPPTNAVPLPLQTADIINGNERNSASSTTVVSCASCSTTFESGDTFFQHWVEKHCKVEAQDDEERCKNCDQRLVDPVTRKKLEIHVCTQKRPQKRKSEDSGCSPNATKGKKSSNHHHINSTANHPVACGVCSKELRTITSFFLHWLDSHHAIMDVLEEVWRCGVCVPNKLFPTRQRGVEHAKEAHRRSETATCFRNCNVCYKDFADAESLNSHKCGIDEIDECGICGGKTPSLEVHLSSESHKLEMIWNRSDKLQMIQKPSGDLTVSTASQISPSISSSMSMTAMNPSVSRCSACNQLFTSEKLLEKHFAQNHDFQCKFCHQRMDKDVYGDHLRQHLASQRKKTGRH